MSQLPPPAPPPWPPPSLPAVGPQKTAWWKPRRSWKWWTVTSVAAFVVLIVIVAIVAPPPKKPVTAVIPNPTATATPAATSFASTVAPAVTPTAAMGDSRSAPVPFGHTANVDGWNVKVVSVTPEATDPLTGKPPAGTTFYVFTLQVTNTSSTPAAPSLSLISDLVGSNNVSYSVVTQPGCYGGNPDNDNVYKGGTVKFGACISVPSNVADLLLNVSGFISPNPTWFATK
jgi:hypothetical protein